MSWEHIETYDDQNGVLSERATFNDNGVVRVASFTDGVRSQIFQYDNPNEAGGGVKSWDRIEAYYDHNGNLTENATFYDNGIVRAEQWDGGQRTQTVQEDTSDIKSWETHTTIFDPVTGQVGGIAIVYDNGVQRDTVYRDGVRMIEETRDASDAFSWDNKVSFFAPDGVRLGSETSMHNGDRIIFAFQDEDGQRDWRLEVDGDNSELWAYRVTEYDVDGINPVVTTYGSITDLSSPYVDSLGLIVI